MARGHLREHELHGGGAPLQRRHLQLVRPVRRGRHAPRRRGARRRPPRRGGRLLLPDARRLVYFDCGATTEGKLRVCYCDDGLPQWLKRKKKNNKGKVGDEKHKVQLRHGALQPEKVLWGDSRGARRRRD